MVKVEVLVDDKMLLFVIEQDTLRLKTNRFDLSDQGGRVKLRQQVGWIPVCKVGCFLLHKNGRKQTSTSSEPYGKYEVWCFFCPLWTRPILLQLVFTLYA